MVQQVKDLALPLLWLRSLLWHRFGSWPGNVHMLQARPKKKKESWSTHSRGPALTLLLSVL